MDLRSPATPLTARDEDSLPTPPRDLPKLLLTVQEAADWLGIGRTLMYELIGKGEIPSVRVGRLRRIRPTDLATYTDNLACVTPDSFMNAA